MSTRRTFLKSSAAAGALVLNPYIWTSSYVKAQDANSKRTIGSIGVGGKRGRYSRGGSVARQAAKLGRTIAVCDVDSRHNEQFNENEMFGGKLNMHIDYREMLEKDKPDVCLLYTSPSPRDLSTSRMPSSA